MIKKESRNFLRKRRHQRLRSKLAGTPERPRLNVFRSLDHLYAQVIDDQNGCTLASASSLDPQLRTELSGMNNLQAAARMGELIAKRAMERGIKQVVFDRGGYLYHGRVKALAEAAREEGLIF